MQEYKTYPFERSPLFKLDNFSKICGLLKIRKRDLQWIKQGNQNYRVFDRIENGKTREIQEPKPPLKVIHKRLLILLCRLPFPPYILSGRKGKSSLENSSVHRENSIVYKEDIQKYFPSCKKEYVFRFFNKRFFIKDDVAWKITALILYRDGIPTGSPVSQAIAYWAYADAFDEVYRFSMKRGVTFTLWVDDMTFSSKKSIPEKFLLGIKGIINKYEQKINSKKSKAFKSKEHKPITGVVVSPKGQLKIPNRLQKKLFDFKELNKNLDDLLEPSRWSDLRSILGVLRYCRQIKKDFWSNYYLALRRIELQIQTQCPVIHQKVMKRKIRLGKVSRMKPYASKMRPFEKRDQEKGG